MSCIRFGEAASKDEGNLGVVIPEIPDVGLRHVVGELSSERDLSCCLVPNPGPSIYPIGVLERHRDLQVTLRILTVNGHVSRRTVTIEFPHAIKIRHRDLLSSPVTQGAPLSSSMQAY